MIRTFSCAKTERLFKREYVREFANIAEAAVEASGTDYNVYVPIANSLSALGKMEAESNFRQRVIQALEAQLREIPDDARARILLGAYYAEDGRVDDAMRESNLAMTLRPNEALVFYNAACTFCTINRKPEALDAIAKAWRAGFRDSDWARRDPTLALIRGEPEFQKLYPEKPAAG